jgi:uncharacterized protein (TIGR02231 family)
VVNPISITSKTVETQIIAATVYTSQALVTRRGAVELKIEDKILIINHLPVTIVADSFRVSGSGRISVRLLGVSLEKTYTSEPVAARVAQLTQHIEELESEMSYLRSQLDGLALQSRFIEGLREKTEEPFAQSISRRNLSLSETMDFVNFIGSQYTEYGIATRDCNNRKNEIEKELTALRQQLQQIQTPHPKESFKLVIPIETTESGEFDLEVSYVVQDASWTPLYDLRVNTNNSIIHLGYFAEVTQNTGEDWDNVVLTLSTAKPGLGTLPPKPEPWYIGVQEFNYSRRLRAEHAFSAPVPMVVRAASGQDEDDYDGQKEIATSIIEAETVTAEVVQEGSVVLFEISRNTSIPSDCAAHKTTIFNDEFSCQFEYVAMPRLVSFAYLQAKVKNPTNGATLLPGKANIFRNNTFVGTTQLENIAPGQEFTVNLGIDEGLKIKRELVERQVDKKLIGNDRKITYAYRLIVTNLLDREAKLKLIEQIPKSRHEQIKVKLIRSNPQIQVGEMGILEWVLGLAPQGKQELFYQFAVEHPANFNIVGLDV